MNCSHYPHLPIGEVWMYRLLFVLCVFVCTVTDCYGEDGASGVKFCRMVQRCPGQEISHLGNFAPPGAQNRTNRRAAASIADRQLQSPPLTVRSSAVEGTGVYRQYLPLACVDIWPSPKTDVLVNILECSDRLS